MIKESSRFFKKSGAKNFVDFAAGIFGRLWPDDKKLW